MSSDLPSIIRSLKTIRRKLRNCTAEVEEDAEPLDMSASAGSVTGFLKAVRNGVRGLTRKRQRFGCRLLHWDPELEHFRAEVIRNGKKRSYIVYRPLNVRVGSRPHAFFARVYKVKYPQTGQRTSDPTVPQRQYGITYSGFQSKSERKAILDAFKNLATEAGGLVASIKGQLSSRLPVETLAVKNDLHRWIFTVYDVAWKFPLGSRRSATKYIPLQGLNAFMGTDESILYDREHIRSTPWPEVERRMDEHGWGHYSHVEESYSSWSEELPEYYASRIDDIMQASGWTIDWLVKELKNAT